MNKKILIIVSVIVVFLLVLGVLIFFNNNKKKNTTNNNSPKISSEPVEGTVPLGFKDLPVVDQAELTQKYKSDISKIIANLEQEIQTAGGMDKVDSGTISKIKSGVLEEVVPKNYQDFHLKFVLMIGKISNGEFDKAKAELEVIKMSL